MADAVSAPALGTRAVLRRIEAGSSVLCEHCGAQVKFRATSRDLQVVANVYVDGRWLRTVHLHEICYRDAGEPYGPADASKVLTR